MNLAPLKQEREKIESKKRIQKIIEQIEKEKEKSRLINNN